LSLYSVILHTFLEKTMIKVNEIFHSIQGESTHAGRPCTFVRLTYCNLRCTYCDTAYAFEEGTEMSVDSIISKVKQFGCKLVEVTGGEPLFQKETPELLKKLCNEGFEVLLETNGSLPIKDVDERVKIIMDLKTPSSGMADHNLFENINFLKANDEIKFVIGNKEDYEWAKRTLKKFNLSGSNVLFATVFGKLEPKTLAEWILEDKLDVRLQLQIHKFIWEPERRGV